MPFLGEGRGRVHVHNPCLLFWLSSWACPRDWKLSSESHTLLMRESRLSYVKCLLMGLDYERQVCTIVKVSLSIPEVDVQGNRAVHSAPNKACSSAGNAHQSLNKWELLRA